MSIADEKALEAYRANQAGLSLESPYVDKAFLAGRASRNSEVEGLLKCLDAVIDERDDFFDCAVWSKNDGKDTRYLFGFHPLWVHADFCPKGIRAITYEGDKWASAKWSGTHDEWIKVIDVQPTFLAKSFPVSPPRQALTKGDSNDNR